MSQQTEDAATLLDATIASIDSLNAGYDADIAAHAGVLTTNQENAAVAYWLEHCLRAKSLLILTSQMFLSNTPLDISMRATKWCALRAERLLQNRRRQQLVSYAASLRDGDNAYGALGLPLAATAEEIETILQQRAREYMVSAANDEVALELLGKKLTNGG